jgi:hypothetical protein
MGVRCGVAQTTNTGASLLGLPILAWPPYISDRWLRGFQAPRGLAPGRSTVERVVAPSYRAGPG